MAKRNKIILTSPAIDRRGNAIYTAEELLKAEAECGCGIDCCEGWVSVRDNNGDIRYWGDIDGVWTGFDTKEEFRAAHSPTVS